MASWKETRRLISKNTTIPTSRKCSPQQPTTRRRWPSSYSKVCPRLRSHSVSMTSPRARSSPSRFVRVVVSQTRMSRRCTKAKFSVAVRRFSWGAMAGDAFISGVCRVGPPIVRPFLRGRRRGWPRCLLLFPSRPAACEQVGAWPLARQAADEDVVKAQEEEEHELQEETSGSDILLCWRKEVRWAYLLVGGETAGQ